MESAGLESDRPNRTALKRPDRGGCAGRLSPGPVVFTAIRSVFFESCIFRCSRRGGDIPESSNVCCGDVASVVKLNIVSCRLCLTSTLRLTYLAVAQDNSDIMSH